MKNIKSQLMKIYYFDFSNIQANEIKDLIEQFEIEEIYVDSNQRISSLKLQSYSRDSNKRTFIRVMPIGNKGRKNVDRK